MRSAVAIACNLILKSHVLNLRVIEALAEGFRSAIACDLAHDCSA